MTATPVTTALPMARPHPWTRRTAVGRLAAATLLGLSLVGCAAPPPAPDTHVEAGFVPPPPGTRLLLLHQPAADPAYRVGDAAAQRRVAEALAQRGYDVAVVDPADHALLLAHEQRVVARRTPQPTLADRSLAEAQALVGLARVAVPKAGAQLLVRTRLVTRITTLHRGTAVWDGQRRDVRVEGAARATAIRGSGPGLSIELVVLDASGRPLVKSFGGIALPYVVHGETDRFRDRDDLFASEQDLVEGIAIALRPLTRP